MNTSMSSNTLQGSSSFKRARARTGEHAKEFQPDLPQSPSTSSAANLLTWNFGGRIKSLRFILKDSNFRPISAEIASSESSRTTSHHLQEFLFYKTDPRRLSDRRPSSPSFQPFLVGSRSRKKNPPKILKLLSSLFWVRMSSSNANSLTAMRQTPLTCSGHTRPVVFLAFSDYNEEDSANYYMISACKGNQSPCYNSFPGPPKGPTYQYSTNRVSLVAGALVLDGRISLILLFV